MSGGLATTDTKFYELVQCPHAQNIIISTLTELLLKARYHIAQCKCPDMALIEQYVYIVATNKCPSITQSIYTSIYTQAGSDFLHVSHWVHFSTHNQ